LYAKANVPLLRTFPLDVVESPLIVCWTSSVLQFAGAAGCGPLDEPVVVTHAGFAVALTVVGDHGRRGVAEGGS
jgi:hypothetical protein